MITVAVSVDMARFNAALAQYMAKTSKTPAEVLEKKGRDLGIRLFNGFRDRKWGGVGKHPRLARAELAARTATGRGTRVRASLMAEYLSQRTALRSALKSFVGPKTDQQKVSDIKKKVSLWQSFVGKEIGLRQRGIGALAASFLWYRSRSNNAVGTYYVKNRNGVNIGFADRGDGYFRVVSDADGAALVDSRYGIVATALTGMADDMIQYLRERHGIIFQEAFKEAAA